LPLKKGGGGRRERKRRRRRRRPFYRHTHPLTQFPEGEREKEKEKKMTDRQCPAFGNLACCCCLLLLSLLHLRLPFYEKETVDITSTVLLFLLLVSSGWSPRKPAERFFSSSFLFR